jgi:hypothetical protein
MFASEDRANRLIGHHGAGASFRRAIERGNLLIAETTARELGRTSLAGRWT